MKNVNKSLKQLYSKLQDNMSNFKFDMVLWDYKTNTGGYIEVTNIKTNNDLQLSILDEHKLFDYIQCILMLMIMITMLKNVVVLN